MDDDWRVLLTFHNEGHAARMLEVLHHRRLSAEVRSRLGEGVVVSSSGRYMFLYADAIDTAKEAGQVARDVLAEHDLHADLRVEHWHPMEEVWDSSPEGMRHDAAKERKAKHENQQYEQRLRSLDTGVPAWLVRVNLPSHHDAVELAKRLMDEGDSVVRRWKFLLVGAPSEDDANALAHKIRGYVPPETPVHIEEGFRDMRGLYGTIANAGPPGNPG